MSFKTFSVVISSFLALLFSIILLWLTSGSVECRWEDSAMRESINGKVIKVFIDSANHADETLKFLMDGEKKTSYIFRGDQSIGFEYLQPGDSIIKREQSLVMEVFRDGQMTAFTLNYECVSP